jgi:hypothetical protein
MGAACPTKKAMSESSEKKPSQKPQKIEMLNIKSRQDIVELGLCASWAFFLLAP